MSVLHRSRLALEQLIPEFTVPAGLAQTTFHAMGTTVALLLPSASGDARASGPRKASLICLPRGSER